MLKPGSAGGQRSSRPSTASPNKSKRKKTEEDNLTIQQSYQSLSYTTSQLQLISQALETINKEKEALGNINAQLRRQIAKTTNDCQGLKKNHERLHNETIKINKATSRLEEERVLMEKECEALEVDSVSCDQEADKHRYEITKLRALIKEESSAVDSLSDMTTKMKKELSLQLRERDSLRTETATATKQIEQLRDKISKLHSSNQKFMRQLKSTAKELGSGLAA